MRPNWDEKYSTIHAGTLTERNQYLPIDTLTPAGTPRCVMVLLLLLFAGTAARNAK
jgi:hypothetical protein